MSQANVHETTRALANKIENLIEVTADGSKVDADLVTQALPEGLSREQLDAVLNFVVDLPEAVDVVVAEKSIGVAKDNADVKHINATIHFNDRVNYTSKWTRQNKGADDSVRYGTTTGKLTVTSSEHHKANLTALEELAASAGI